MSLAKNRKRRSTRWKGYDYSLPGVFLMRVVTWQRKMLFPENKQFEMVLNDIGAIVRVERTEQGKFREEFGFDEFAVTQNQLHTIVYI